MRILFSPVLIFGMLFLVSCTDTARHPVGNEKENARVFVQQFYDWYKKLYNQGVTATDNVGTDVYMIKHKPQYLDDSLLKAFIEYYKAEPKDADEVVGLDFDPILDSQDIGWDYQTGKVKQVGDTFFVNIHCDTHGKPKDKILALPPIIVAEVVKKSGHWKLVNLSYPPPEGKGEDLLKMLE
ncbi:MAG: hypothetical protein ACXVIY_13320, partial [Mucilaginibacter sp.]